MAEYGASKVGLAGLVYDYLDTQYSLLLVGEQALREGRFEVTHPTRVATRRYRTVLREMADLFEETEAIVTGESLRWYAAVLGQVRDQQIVRGLLAEQLDQLPIELVTNGAREILDQRLNLRERNAKAAVIRSLEHPRYRKLLDQLRTWHDESPLRKWETTSDDAVAHYVKRAKKRYRRRQRTADDEGRPAELVHDARKAAKRARYVAEIAEPALGKPAMKQVKRMTRTQDRLGRTQDAGTALAFLLELAQSGVTHPDPARGGVSHPDPADGVIADTPHVDPLLAGFTLGYLYSRLEDR